MARKTSSARLLTLLSLVATLAVFSPAQTVTTSRQKHKPKLRATPTVAPAIPIGPPVGPPAVPTQATLAESPASPPTVNFQNGKLSIFAPNSTLGDVLRSVRGKTGAAIEIPGNATERVVGEFGPGPAREVLAELLNGSHFNYVILSSAENVNVLDRVVLLQRTASETTSENLPGIPNPRALGVGPTVIPQNQEMDAPDEAADDAAETETPEMLQQPQPEQPPPGPGQPGIRTPEQLLQELQRRQQGGQPGGVQPTPNQPGQSPDNQ